MQNQDYKNLLTDVIKKQILILGHQIVTEKVKLVNGISIDEDGNVLEINGDPQKIIQALINQFVELSGLIVKKTMEPLLLFQVETEIREITGTKQSPILNSQTNQEQTTPNPNLNPASNTIPIKEIPEPPIQIDQDAQRIINSALDNQIKI